jgi:hypothetical protein
MVTQVIRIQTDANLGRTEQVEAGKFTNFIETVKKLFGVQHSASHGGIEYSSKSSLKRKAEIDAYFAGVGLV